MCGFFGVINKNIFEDSQKIRLEGLSDKISKSISHRGPDDSGMIFEENILLIHRRLSIIDIENGKQPMVSNCGRYYLVYNGEIYNFVKLKSVLEKKGYVFNTRSDTEVLLYGIIEFGSEICNMLNGMFSFVFYDKLQKKLLFARDIAGEKPLFFYKGKNEFVFSSEIKAIRFYCNSDLSHKNLSMFFKFQYIPEPFTAYKEIFKLEAGSFLEIDLCNLNIVKEKYFKPIKRHFNGDLYNAVRKFDEKLEKSVEEMLVSDVPVGAFLSGGIDSTLIVRSMRRLDDKRNIHTFSVGFDEKRYDESKYSFEVSKKYKTEHHHVYFSQKDVIENIHILNHFDEPFGDSSSVALFFLAKKTSEVLKVILSGDGSDELFGGYRRYFMENRYKNIRKIPVFIRKALAVIFEKSNTFYSEGLKKLIRTSFEDDYYTAVMSNFNKRESEYTLKLDFCDMSIFDIFYKNSGIKGEERFMHCDFNTYLPNDILKKVDIMTMSNSVEARAPFLSGRMIEFAFSLSPDLKRHKCIPKLSLESEWGKDFIYRPKKGFGVPLDKWFKEDLGVFLRKIIKSSDRVDYFLKKNNVLKLLERHDKGIKNYSYELWQFLVFIMWLEKNENIICS